MPVQPLQGQRALAPVDAQWRAPQGRRLDEWALRGAATLLLLVFASGSSAQISGTASVLSDYRYRGITLSGKKPAAQLGVTYDDPLGWYAGAFGSTTRFTPPLGSGSQAMVFAGFASRLSSGVSLEAGGDYSMFDNAARYNYGETFLGVAGENLSVRIHYSQKYYGQRANSVYGEINYAQPLIDRVRLSLHAGFLRTGEDSGYGSGPDRRIWDGRIGCGVEFDLFQLELAWVGISRANAAYRLTQTTSSNTFVLTISRAF